MKDLDKEDKAPDSAKNDGALWRHWHEELELSHKFFNEYLDRIESIYEEYRAEPSGEEGEAKRANIWFSTVEALKPSIFSSVPEIDIRRRRSASDKIARLSAEIWERTVSYSQDQHQNSYYVYERARDDYLLAGRPILWERYEPALESVTEEVPLTEEDQAAGKVESLGVEFKPADVTQAAAGPVINATYEKLVSEKCITDYVHAEDFRHNAARTEDEIRWKARRHFLNRRQLKEKFGKTFKAEFSKDIAEEVKPDKAPDAIEKITDSDEAQRKYQTAKVWEIWDKESKRIYYLAEGWKDGCLEVKDAPSYIDGFFPCASSCVTSVTPDTVLPIPEYCQVRDQCQQINTLTERIEKLEDRCRANGAYPAQYIELGQLITANDALIPVRAMPPEGADKNLITWSPIEIFTAVLKALYEARDREIQLFYQICRYSDVMRGVTDPRETAKAVEAKQQYGNSSLEQKQRDFQQFIRDQLRIKAAIIAENFSDETFQLAAGDLNEPVAPEEFAAALQLLRDEYRVHYVIEIETDSTIAPDRAREKEQVNEFMGAVPSFIQQAIAFAQGVPGMMIPMVELMKGLIRKYKFGRSIEGAFDSGIQQMQQALAAQAQQPAQLPPEVQAQMALAQAEMQKANNQGQKNQMDYQTESQKLQAEYAQKAAELKAKTELEAASVALKQRELAIKEQELLLKARELSIKEAELNLNAQKTTADLHLRAFDSGVKAKQAAQPTMQPEKEEKEEKPKTKVAKIIRGTDGRAVGMEVHEVGSIS